MGVSVSLDVPLHVLPGVSEKAAARFAKAGVATVREALLHLPVRYEDRSHLTAVADYLFEFHLNL